MLFISDKNGKIPTLSEGILVSLHLYFLPPHSSSDRRGKGRQERKEVEGGPGARIVRKNTFFESNVH